MISDPHLGTDASPLLLPGGEVPVGALLLIRGPVTTRALRRFRRDLATRPGAPAVVVDDEPLDTGSVATQTVVGPERVLARTLGAGRDTPRCTLYVEGRRVWEHHGLRRSHLPDAGVVAERARTLRGFDRAA